MYVVSPKQICILKRYKTKFIEQLGLVGKANALLSEALKTCPRDLGLYVGSREYVLHVL